MNRSTVEPSTRPGPDTPVVQTVTVIMGTVVALTFLFGFGNVLNLALRLGVPAWVAPLVAPAVDLSILGLLLGTRHLALHGATQEQLRPARRLLTFASLTTLALNIADPLVTGAYGKAAVDAVGPLLLIGWAEVGPGLLQAISTFSPQPKETTHAHSNGTDANTDATTTNTVATRPTEGPASDTTSRPVAITPNGDLLGRARHEDARHWTIHQQPISAETLRKNLRISATRSRELVSIVRAERSSDRTAATVAAGQSPSG